MPSNICGSVSGSLGGRVGHTKSEVWSSLSGLSLVGVCSFVGTVGHGQSKGGSLMLDFVVVSTVVIAISSEMKWNKN